jgi:AcrR family transcriptional regulator
MPKVVPGYKAQARARIVQAGLAIFSRRGFRRTTMADIAKEVGVSKGDLYLYFPSKIDLLAEIQSASQRESRELMARSLVRKEAPEALIQVFESMVEDPPGPQMLSTWFEVLAEASSDPRIGEVLRTDHREDLRIMKGFLRQSRKQPPGGDPRSLDDLALATLLLFHGAAMELALGSSRNEVRRALRHALRALLRPPG